MKNKKLVDYKGYKTMAPIVEHNPTYKNFLVSDSALRDGIIYFSYRKNGRSAGKVIPTMSIMEFLKQKRFYKYDEEEDRMKYCGYAYSIPDSIVFNYNS